MRIRFSKSFELFSEYTYLLNLGHILALNGVVPSSTGLGSFVAKADEGLNLRAHVRDLGGLGLLRQCLQLFVFLLVKDSGVVSIKILR